MYDKAQTLSDTNLKKSSKGLRETSGFVNLNLFLFISFIFFVFIITVRMKLELKCKF